MIQGSDHKAPVLAFMTSLGNHGKNWLRGNFGRKLARVLEIFWNVSDLSWTGYEKSLAKKTLCCLLLRRKLSSTEIQMTEKRQTEDPIFCILIGLTKFWWLWDWPTVSKLAKCNCGFLFGKIFMRTWTDSVEILEYYWNQLCVKICRFDSSPRYSIIWRPTLNLTTLLPHKIWVIVKFLDFQAVKHHLWKIREDTYLENDWERKS